MKSRSIMNTATALGVAFSLAAAGGCIRTKNEIEGGDKPIKIEATLNVNVRVQREVNDIYDSIYGSSASPAATTQPAGT